MFIYMFFAGMLAEQGQNQNDTWYAVGYFLSSVAVLMTIGCLIMAYKLKKINDINDKTKKNINL